VPEHSDFVHLHLHTEYSLLDGAIALPRLFPRLREFGMSACAVTDHGNMYGVVQFYKQATDAGIRPILGVEIYVAPGSRFDKTSTSGGKRDSAYHLILLATSETGYRNLCRLVTLGHLDGFYYHPRVDRELLEKHHEGLIAMSACLSGEIPEKIVRGKPKEALEAADWYRQVFGPDRFYLELQINGLPDQTKANEGLLAIHAKTGIPVVATNDAHYLLREEARAHEVLLCIGTQKTMSDADRMRMDTDEFYVKSPREMEKAFAAWPDALANTRKVAEMVDFTMAFGETKYPRFEVPEGKSLAEHLHETARDGVRRRLDADYKGLPAPERERTEREWMARLDFEMNLIRDKGFAGYFLIVHDIVRFARENGVPVGPGRGSAAGSLLSYAIGITDIDPIRYGLLFERFLNPERTDNPDIDMDFCADGREKVIRYVTEKYGEPYVAQISTFGTMKAKAVVRDVGRALGRPYGEVDAVAKLVPFDLNMTLDKAIRSEPRLGEMMQREPWVAELMAIARPLEGLNRHASTHAAGIVIGNRPLVEYLPLYRGSEGEIVTQFDKRDVEAVGLIKFDLLGLKTLTVIDKALRLIERTRNVRVDVKTLPMDDAETFALLQRGDTTGVFQFESAGMKELLVKIRPTVFEDVIVMAAIYRPGPLGSGMVDDFVARKHGRQEVVYDLPIMRDVLEETYGIMVYQEQVMEVARAVGGFSLGESDLLRRAMAKKDVKKMPKYEAKFLEGAKARAIDPRVAKAIFDKMAKFAEYGFNKSHSAAYAMVAYQTAYLKAHYPAEFMAALMSMETGDSDRLMTRLQECREMGLTIDPPDVGRSLRDFTVEDGRIVFGLAAVKGVGEGAIESILAAREKLGRFASLYDFCEEIDPHLVNRRALESLIKAGACDGLGGHRAQLLAGLDRAMERAAGLQRDRSTGQTNLFDSFRAARKTSSAKPPYPDLPSWEPKAILEGEKEALGFYLSGHPLQEYEDVIGDFMTADTARIREIPHRSKVTIAGIVTGLKYKDTRRGGKMAFVSFEDLKGTTEVIVFPDVLDAARDLLESARSIVVKGETDAGEKGVKILAGEVHSLSEVRESWSREVIFQIDAERVQPDALQGLREIVGRYPGPCRGRVHVRLPERSVTVVALPEGQGIRPVSEMVREVRELLGREAVRFR
jgi:DNA polymerase-3 subunit alpha